MLIFFISALFVLASSETPTLYEKENKETEKTSATHLILLDTQFRAGGLLTLDIHILKATDSNVLLLPSVYLSRDVGWNNVGQPDDSKKVLAFEEKTVPPGGKGTLSWNIPKDFMTERYASLVLFVKSRGGLEFTSKPIYLTYMQNDGSIHIQTDKEMYKPGQTVHIRFFKTTPNLKIDRGLLTYRIKDDQNGATILEEKDLTPPSSGVMERSYELPTELNGTLTIEIESGHFSETKQVKANDYVLPRVSVEVNVLPVYTELLASNGVDIEVAAKYVFGTPAKGLTSIKVYENYREKNFYEFSSTLDADGKAKFNIPLIKLKKIVNKNCNEEDLTSSRCLTYRRLTVEAEVTEENTDRTYKAEGKFQFIRSVVNIKFLDISSQNFKLGMAYETYIQVDSHEGITLTQKDLENLQIVVKSRYQTKTQRTTTTGKPPTMKTTAASGTQNNATSTTPGPSPMTTIPDLLIEPGYPYIPYDYKYFDLEEKTFDVPVSTFLKYEINVPNDAYQLGITAKLVNKYDPDEELGTASKFISPAKSPSNTFLTLMAPKDTIKANVDVQMKAVTTTPVAQIEFRVYAKGKLEHSQIVSGFQKINGLYEKVFSFPSTTSMAPACTVFAYFLTDDSELVVDGMTLAIDGLFHSNIDVKFLEPKIKPGETAKIEIETEPDSMVFMRAVDESVDLLAGGRKNDITVEMIQMIQSKYDNKFSLYSARQFFICWFPWYWGAVDAYTVLQNIKMAAITDATVYRYQGEPYYEYYPRSMTTTMPVTTTAGLPTTTMFSSVGQSGSNDAKAKTKEKSQERKHFLETWLWDNAVVSNQGYATIERKVPDTITTWVLSAFGVSENKGLTVLEKPAKLITIKDMFVSCQLPRAIVRGDIYCFPCAVYNNYQDKDLDITVEYENKEHIRNIHIIQDGSTKKLTTEETKASRFVNVQLGAQESFGTKFCIKPETLGEHDIVVNAMSDQGDVDIIVKKLIVKPEGKVRSTISAYLIQDFINQWSEDIPLVFPPGIVEDSERLKINVGSLLAPMIENLDDLLGMPYGCGEQNMIKFAPNIYIFRFLHSTGRSDPKIEQKAVRYMESGYTRQLRYRDGPSSGSYCTFCQFDGEERGKGSTLLTAFVLKCFAEALQLYKETGKGIQIDVKNIETSTRFLVSKQIKSGENMNTFREDGVMYNKRLLGTAGRADGSIAFTAYAVCSLYQAIQVLQDSRTIEMTEKAMTNSLDFLREHVNEATNPSDSCIAAYALYLADRPSDQDARNTLFNMIEKQATKVHENDGSLRHLYWKAHKETFTQKRSYWRDEESQSIEITSYCLLVYTLRSTGDNKNPILRWLTKQKSPFGGYGSTQSTIVAMKAITQVAAEWDNSVGSQLDITVKYGDKSHQFEVNRQNEFILQSLYIPNNEIPTNQLTIEASASTGTPYKGVVAEVIKYYNIDKKDVIESDYSINLNTDVVEDTTCVVFEVKVKKEAGMTLVHINCPTGYKFVDESVKNLYLNAQISRIEKTEENEDGRASLDLYVDTGSLNPNNPLAVKVCVMNEGNTPQSTVGWVLVSDYYEESNEEIVYFDVKEGELRTSVCEKYKDVGRCQLTQLPEK